MSNRFKPILPAPSVPKLPEGEPTGPLLGSSSTTLRQRRSSVRVACNGCRAKRTACDGNRPTCSHCAKRGTPCVYVSTTATETPTMVMKREMGALRKKYEQLSEAFEALRDLPENASILALRSLRLTTAMDPAVLLASIVRSNPGDGVLPRMVLARPPSQGSEEFALMLRHAFAYPALLPLDAAAVSRTTFFPGGAPILEEPMRQARSSLSPFKTSQPSSGLQSPSPASSLEPLAAGGAVDHCDDRLLLLEISHWVFTPMSNSLAAALLSLYLTTDHPTLGLFDAGLFLDDLAARRFRFCSPLLVCSILVWACHAYSSLLPALEPIREALLAEAKSLWDRELAYDSLPTLAAAQLLNLNCIYNGHDGEHSYLSVGSDMAQRMGLFGTFRTQSPFPVGNDPVSPKEDWDRAVAHTAWGVYNCISMNAFMFQSCETALGLPPLLDIPGDMNERQADEDIADGAPAHDLPDYMGRTFPAMCAFWVITSEWTSRYYPPVSEPVVGRVPWAFAEATFKKLLKWTDSLHFRLARGDQAPHHSTILHIWFHASISQLFRPFAMPLRNPALSLEDAEHSVRADAIFRASVHQLKHITLAFRFTYACSSYAIFWHMALLYVANAALEDIGDPQWRTYFTLCLNCYADLFGTFRVAEGIVRSLLSVAMRKGMLGGAEAQTLLQRAMVKGSPYQSKNISSGNGFVVDLNLAVTDRKAAQLQPLAELFENLRLFHEFVNADVLDGTGSVDEDSPLPDADP